jgi:hypothetical protein
MTERPEIQVILKQFPWAGIAGGLSDKGFNHELALAMRYLLGTGPNFGWWTMDEPDTSLTLKAVFATRGPPPCDTWGSIFALKQTF